VKPDLRLLRSEPLLAKYAGALLVSVALAYLVYVTLTRDVFFTRYYRRYTAYLDRTLRLLFIESSSGRIVGGQLVAVIVVTALGLVLELPFWYAFLALVALGPWLYLGQKRVEYIRKLELQVDSMILGLANSLKTVPSPAAALSALAPILPVPTKYEVDRILKEMRVGSTLEQAIMNMSVRLKSVAMDSALSALLIGLQVGGNLPTVLENTASTIREMNRLEGVVKSKTSEGRAQLWVLALFPFGLCLAFSQVQEGYFDPLQSSFVGYLITSAAIALWLTSLFVARKVLKVDI
jgi:tight adherence protein B